MNKPVETCCWPTRSRSSAGASARVGAPARGRRGAYIDDMPELAGTLHAALGLSPVAHGAHRRASTSSRIRSLPGVVAVFTAADIPGGNDCGADRPRRPDPGRAERPTRASYLGQPVFAVIADDARRRRGAPRAGARRLDIDAAAAVLTPQRGARARSSTCCRRCTCRAATRHAAHRRRAAPARRSASTSAARSSSTSKARSAYADPARGRRHAGALLDPAPDRDAAPGGACAAAARRTTCRSSAGAWAAASAARNRSRRCSPASPRWPRARLKRPVKLRARPRRRLPRSPAGATASTTTARSASTTTAASSAREVDDGLARRLLGRPVGPGDDARAVPLRQRLLAAARRDPRLLGQAPTRRATPPSAASAGRRARSRSSTSSTAIARAPGQATRSTCAAPTSTASDDAQRHAVRPDRRRQHHPRAGRRARSAAATTARAAPRSRAFNAASPVLKKGLALTPVKFGISFNVTHLNQAGALVHVYTDGSVLVNHGGTEMGQGLNTKVAQVVAHELGVPLAQRARAPPPTRRRSPTPRPPPPRTGSDLNGKAAQDAARQIRERLAAFAAERAWRRRRRRCASPTTRCAVGGAPALPFARAGRRGLHGARAAVERRLLRHARPALGPRDDDGPAVLLLRLRRGGQRSAWSTR